MTYYFLDQRQIDFIKKHYKKPKTARSIAKLLGELWEVGIEIKTDLVKQPSGMVDLLIEVGGDKVYFKEFCCRYYHLPKNQAAFASFAEGVDNALYTLNRILDWADRRKAIELFIIYANFSWGRQHLFIAKSEGELIEEIQETFERGEDKNFKLLKWAIKDYLKAQINGERNDDSFEILGKEYNLQDHKFYIRNVSSHFRIKK